MRVLVDTNIIIAAMINPFGKPSLVLNSVIAFHEMYVCRQTLTELTNFLSKKRAQKYQHAESIFNRLLKSAIVLDPLQIESALEFQIRDATDRPILRAAVESKVDIILTGDRDFLESGIESPQILTASEFLDLF